MERSLSVHRSRNGTIDFLKFIFALVVVIFHGRKLAAGNEFAFFQSGYLAVEFFFLVSGFLMMRSASRVTGDRPIGHETVSFLARKIKGLYPAILFAFVPALATVTYIGSVPATAGSILSSVWEISLLRMSGIQGTTANTITWYISAMLIAMLLLSPLILKFKDSFSYIIAPLAFIFIMGYLSQTGSLISPEKWMSVVYRGLLRALGELCLGCVCWQVSEQLKKISFTAFARVSLFVLQWGCILFSLGIMNVPASKLGYVCIILLAIGITIGFSGISALTPPPRGVLPGRICSWLGAFSLPLYLNHAYIRHIFRYVLKLPYGYETQLILFVLSSVAAALIAMYAVEGARRLLSGKIQIKEDVS